MKLLHLLQHLPPADRTDLPKMVAALYPKLRADAVRLLAYIVDNQVFSASEWQNEAVFAYLYGNDAAYNNDWLRHAQSLLVKAIEGCVAAKKAAERTEETAFLVADFYAETQDDRYFQQAYKQLQASNAVAFPQNEQQYYRLARAENLWFRYTTENQRIENTNLQTILAQQEKYFAAAQLRTACTALSYQNFYKTEFDFGLLKPLLERIAAQNWQQTEPIIGAYFFIYKMTTEAESEPFFAAFRQNMPVYAQLFDGYELRECYISAINYVIKCAHKGQTEYFRTLFELYKEGVENGVLLGKTGDISAFTYKNVVATSLRVGETDYALAFLQKFKNELPKDLRKNYYQYALARYYFTVRDFENALPFLLKLTYGDLFLQLDAKVILLKLYYENDDFDALDAHLRKCSVRLI